MNKTILALLAIVATGLAKADVTFYRGGGGWGRRGTDLIHVEYKKVPLSDPSEPFHDTYRKNTGEVSRKAPKPIANLHAKQSAAQADALRTAAKMAAAQRPTISVYSNITPAAQTTRTQPTRENGGTPNTITINNSNVVINN